MTVLYTRFKKMCSLDCVSSRRMMMVPLLLGDLSYRLWKSEGGGGVSFSLSLSLVLERKSNNTLERRRPEEDPKENDNNSKKKQSAFLLCRDDLRRRLQKKRVCFVAPFNKCREYRRGTQSERERERERRRSHTKKGIKLSRKEISHI